MKTRPRLIPSALLLGYLCSSALADQIVIHPALENSRTSLHETPPRHYTILIKFVDAKGKPQINPPPLIITPAVSLGSSYKVTLVNKNGMTKTIEIEKAIPTASVSLPAGEAAASLRLLPKQEFTDEELKDVVIKVEPKKDVWAFTSSYAYESKDMMIAGNEVITELQALKMRTLENKVELLNGSTVGVGSVRVTYRYDNMGSFEWLHLEALGKADFNFRSEDKTKYFNSIVGELSAFYIGRFPNTVPDSGPSKIPLESESANPKTHYTIPYQVGVSGSLESDQTFETMNATGGLLLTAYVPNPVTDTLYALLVPNILATERGLSPCFKLGYKYVGHIKEGVNTGTGNQRLTADFYWSMPVARGWRLPEVIYKDTFDADLLIDVETAYDTEKSKFFNNSKLTLDFHSHSKPDKSPSITFTYAQGKATPTFKHFDAFLAGFKLPF